MVGVSLEEDLKHDFRREAKTTPGEELEELLRLEDAIAVGVADREELLEVLLEHGLRHLIPLGHVSGDLGGVIGKTAILSSAKDGKHSRHELVELNHAILVDISLTNNLENDIGREVEARARKQIRELSWRKHAVAVDIADREELPHVVLEHGRATQP